jgi:monovalent cation:H+ antiporter-2, CPA2 family
MALDFSASGFRDALVVLGAAGIVIPAFARFRVTPVIGFLIVGALVGPHGLGALAGRYPWLEWVTISNAEAIDPFGELGIILLLFSIGLELSFRRLWSMRRRVFVLGPAELIGSGALIALALLLFGWTPAAAIGLGVALALSSTALVMPIAGTTSSVGRLAFPMLLFEDLAIVPTIFLLGAVGMGASGGIENLAFVAGTGLVTVLAMLIAGRVALPPLFAQAARTKSPELFMSASLLVVILASFATAAAGLSPIVGALIAGLVIAETEYRTEVEATVAPFKGLALGIFLISVGMGLNIEAILVDWPKVVLAVAGVIAIKTAVTFALLRLGRVKAGISAEVAVLMASPSELTLIVLAAALQAGLVDAADASFWQLVTAIGLTITPLLARIGHDVARRIEWREEASRPDPESGPEPRTIVIGYGRVGRMVGEMLDAHGQKWVAIESNVDSVTVGRRAGKDVRFGDAKRHEVIDGLDPGAARAIVLTMDDPVQSIRLIKRLRARFADLTIVARARDPDHAVDLYKAGASDAVPETLESSLQLSESVLVDLGVAMGPVIASIHEKREELRTAIKHRGELEQAPRLRPSKR